MLYPYSYETQISAICTKEAALYTLLQSLLRTEMSGTLPDAVISYNQQISAVSKQMSAASNGERGVLPLSRRDAASGAGIVSPQRRHRPLTQFACRTSMNQQL